MSDPTPGKRGHPWLDVEGPRANVPPTGGAGPLPYATGSSHAHEARRRGLLITIPVLALLAVIGAGTWLTAQATDGSGDPAVPVAQLSQDPFASTTTAPARTATTTTITATVIGEAAAIDRDPTTTTTRPTTTSTGAVAVADLPRHEAVYRDGKLVLQGTVPSKAIADRFRKEAAAVIGPTNVIVRYRIDPRVPTPTDGRVRVDEAFLFPKNSAEIDPRYEPLMNLGVTVLRINPQAKMRIVGYTDDSGTTEVNLRLSQARAEALRRYIASKGIDPKRIQAVGRGEVDFVAPNDTEAHRAKNRRIEVVLLDLLAG